MADVSFYQQLQKDIGVCKVRLVLQALMVIQEDSNVLRAVKQHCDELSQLLQTEPLSGSDASKQSVIERVVNGSASLIHILGHGLSVGISPAFHTSRNCQHHIPMPHASGCFLSVRCDSVLVLCGLQEAIPADH